MKRILLLAFLVQSLCIFAQNAIITRGDSLINMSFAEMKANNLQNSLSYAKEALDLQKETYGENSPQYYFALDNLAFVYSQNKEYSKAIELKLEQLNLCAQMYGDQSAEYAAIIQNISFCYLMDRKYPLAKEYGEQALSIYAKVKGVDSAEYDLAINTLVLALERNMDYDRAIQLKEEQRKRLEELFKTETVEYGNILLELCKFYTYILNTNDLGYFEKQDIYNTAVDYGKKALDIYEKVTDGNSVEFDIAVMFLTNLYNKNQDYDSLIGLNERALSRAGTIYGTESIEYASALENLASTYSMTNDYENAIRYISEAAAIVGRIKGYDSKEYVDTAYQQAIFTELAGKFDEAKEIIVPLLSTKEKLLVPEDADYIEQKYEIANTYAKYERHEDAVKVVQDLVSYLKNKEDGSNEYASALGVLADYKLKIYDYTGSIELINESLSIREKTKDMDYVKTLVKKSDIEYLLGDYTCAIETDEKALEACDMIKTDDASSYKELILTSLSSSYSALGNKRKASLLDKESRLLMEKRTGEKLPDLVWLDIENDINGGEDLSLTNKEVQELLMQINNTEIADLESYGMKNTTDYADVLISGFGGTYMAMKDFNSAQEKIGQGMKILEEVIGKNNMEYEFALELSASCQWELDDKESCIDLLRQALEISMKVLPENHPAILSLQTKIANLEFFLNSQNAVGYAIEASDGLKKLMSTSFSQLAYMERNLYWNKFKNWFQKDLLNIAYTYKNEDINRVAYDGVLFSKGLLLNSEIEMSRLISESNDKDLLNKYYRLRLTRSEYNNLKENNPVLKDSLENVLIEIERDLLSRCKAYGDYTRNLSIDWKQVQQKLGDKDIAIEFVSFPTKDNKVLYAAYCLRKGMIAPEMYPLFESKQLKAVASGAYSRPNVSRLIWEPLQNELANVDNIYFSPAGELYNIAIESLPSYDGNGMMYDRFKLYRLSSTRELAAVKDKSSIDNAALYGGLQYDTDVQVLEIDAEKYPDRDFSLSSLADSLEMRSGASALPASKIEVESIDRSLKSASISHKLFMGLDGTEGSFKDLSGKKTSLMHIATHGFYWNESEADSYKLSFLMPFENSGNTEDKAMTRSGLLFTGANNALTGKPLPENANDGIMTAQEIATLDLRGLDLVVLSACQTGLGEITGDGVCGLQRGFKKAGANSLLMSLWEVNDKATQMLMTKFYEYLLSGKSKYESLILAQKYLREYEEVEVVETPDESGMTASQKRRAERLGDASGNTTAEKIVTRPFADPRYWAAFILLDALD